MKSPFTVIILIFLLISLLHGCSVPNQVSRISRTHFNDSISAGGFIGICIYEPEAKKYWFKQNASRYFIPASNTKLLTLYAALKYLGDSLTGIRYFNNELEAVLIPTGDPTFLHPSFSQQRVLRFLAEISKPVKIHFRKNYFEAFPGGWSTDDYNASYMPERSQLPLYGNLSHFSGPRTNIHTLPTSGLSIQINQNKGADTALMYLNKVVRDPHQNDYTLFFGETKNKTIEVPFITSDSFASKLLSDTLHKSIIMLDSLPAATAHYQNVIYSYPLDTVLRFMMHHSDNFIAEQLLLMISDKLINHMDDGRIMDSLLQTDFSTLPQKPRWADASGLSRYNLVSPDDFVHILERLIIDFGWLRIRQILPTGGQGTLSGYFHNTETFIHAKSGSMSGIYNLSGYLVTKKGKRLIFSVLSNNRVNNNLSIRTATENFLLRIRERY